MDYSEITDKVCGIVADIFECDPRALSAKTRLMTDLPCESIDLLEIGAAGPDVPFWLMTTWCFCVPCVTTWRMAENRKRLSAVVSYLSRARKALALGLSTRMPSRSPALMTLRRTSARRCLRRNMNRVVITGIGCCTSLGWEQGGIARAFAGGCPAFAPSEALPGYSACPVSDLGDDAAYSRFSTWRHRRYLNRGAAFAVLSGLRAADSAGFDPHMPPQTCLIGASAPCCFDRENGLPPADSEALDALALALAANTGNTALARFSISTEGLVLGTACASRCRL
ncbi:MAG: hypothetical protein ACLSAH_16060 [Bilophila wadsworthia]